MERGHFLIFFAASFSISFFLFCDDVQIKLESAVISSAAVAPNSQIISREKYWDAGESSEKWSTFPIHSSQWREEK